VKEFKNRLRFDKVTAKSLVDSFFWNTVYLTDYTFSHKALTTASHVRSPITNSYTQHQVQNNQSNVQ